MCRMEIMAKSPEKQKWCPFCDQPGHSVKRITLLSLLKEAFHEKVDGSDWRFCETPSCSAVYFEDAGEAVFEKNALTVRVGIKESDAPRTICYCFNHSVEEIEEEVAATGSTRVLEDIKERMKTACWCETSSPRGSCCLSTVRRFVREIEDREGVHAPGESEVSAEVEHCCAPPAENELTEGDAVPKDRRRLGQFATLGAMVSAVLSSACCWLPLVLLAFGASVAGVAEFFEEWRLWFLGGSTVLLGVGFYYSYAKESCCSLEASCENKRNRIRRFNRIMLWTAAAFVAVMMLFPNILSTLSGGINRSAVASELAGQNGAIILPIGGMTCEACAVTLESSLAAMPEVTHVAVDYEGKRAVIILDEETAIASTAIHQRIEESGYSVTEMEEATE